MGQSENQPTGIFGLTRILGDYDDDEMSVSLVEETEYSADYKEVGRGLRQCSPSILDLTLSGHPIMY